MDRFTFPASPAEEANIITRKGFRITLLTPCLLRLESGNYTDMPTQTVWNRDLGTVEYRAGEKENLFAVRTREVTFTIDTERCAMKHIKLADGTKVTDFESGNLLGTARTLDMVNGSTKLEKGILSRSGVAVMDDSSALLLGEKGRIMPRETCSDKYYFAYGHDYKRALRDFFRLTGPVPLIPKFALGNWWSRYKAYTQQEYRELMEEFIRRKLPITVATIDMDWHWTDVLQRFGKDAKPGKPRCKEEMLYNHILPGWTGYSWNAELFPDHRALLEWLHEKGFHVTLNVHPSQGIRYFEDCYQDMCEALGKDPAKRACIPFDIGDPNFVEAYFDRVHHPHEKDGVDFWWLDWQQGKVTNIPGLDPLWALNHFHTLDNGRGEKRPLILSRYAGLGSHRYPLGFSGDTHCTWASLEFQPYFTNTAANAGYFWWSHDIGGHMRGVQDDELYLRWLQYGVFSPINRLHSSNSEYMGKEPWKRCYAVKTVAEDFLRLRHRMIPYLYSANYRTHSEGIPICMPMYYEYDCDEAYEAKNQYIFGSQLLVCPITESMDRRINLAKARVWLPEGRWTDIFTGRIYRGSQWVNMYRDLDSIPVLAKEGAIVPMYSCGESNCLSLEQPLEINVWRGNGKFALYEDDGETVAYCSGKYALTEMEIQEKGDTLRFTIRKPAGDVSLLPGTRMLHVRFRDVVSAQVNVNGETCVPADAACVEIPVCFTGEALEIQLNNCIYAKNLPLKRAEADLITRVQCANSQKSDFLSKKAPNYVKNVLQELARMDYTI